MILCKCGIGNSEEAKFCINCGNSLSSDTNFKMEEKIFYTARNVLVTETELKIRNNTHYIKDISSASSSAKVRRAKRGGGIFMIIFGPVLFIVGVVLFGSYPHKIYNNWNNYEYYTYSDQFVGSVFLITIGILLLIAGILVVSLKRSKYAYYVRINDQTGVKNVVASYDKVYVQDIVDAINLAVHQYLGNRNVENNIYSKNNSEYLEKLKELAKLRSDGIISEAEFIAMKQNLLSKR